MNIRALLMNIHVIALFGILVVSSRTATIAEERGTMTVDDANIQLRGNMHAFHHKLNELKKAHVGFIGGSITENRGGHTAMVPAWLRDAYPDVEFKFTNAGISSTCSTTGAFRLESDLLSKGELDLLIVEFAVNDDQDAAHSHENCVRGMEGIIRRAKRHNRDIAIVMVHFVNPGMLAMLQAGDTPRSIAAHHKVAKHYQVTEVNLAAEVAARTKERQYTWYDYGGTHPKRFGYEIASSMIVAALKGQLAKAKKVPTIESLPEPIDSASYHRGRLVSVANAELTGAWKRGKATRALLPIGAIRDRYTNYDLLRGETPGDQLKLNFRGNMIGAFILAGPDAGIVSASIDGATPTVHDLFHRHSGGLNYPRSVIFGSELGEGEHTLELTIEKKSNAKSKGNAVNVLFFEVNS